MKEITNFQHLRNCNDFDRSSESQNVTKALLPMMGIQNSPQVQYTPFFILYALYVKKI